MVGHDGLVPVVDRSPCAVCTNGLLEIRRQDGSGRVFAQCQECMTGYWEPDMNVSLRGEDAGWTSSPASMEDAMRAGWPLPEVVE
jgi:hypothetical protein